ncbi:MAG: PIN domain-containing protein [Methanomicrobiales archaeon]
MERDPEKIRCVIDTNILIGALVKDNSFKARLLKKQNFSFFFPDYGLIEIEKFRDYIGSKRNKVPAAPSFDYAIKFLLESVTIIPRPLYRDKLLTASTIMEEIDPKDTPFLALALHLDCPIWSDAAHLKKQSYVPCYSTREFLAQFDKDT